MVNGTYEVPEKQNEILLSTIYSGPKSYEEEGPMAVRNHVHKWVTSPSFPTALDLKAAIEMERLTWQLVRTVEKMTQQIKNNSDLTNQSDDNREMKDTALHWTVMFPSALLDSHS